MINAIIFYFQKLMDSTRDRLALQTVTSDKRLPNRSANLLLGIERVSLFVQFLCSKQRHYNSFVILFAVHSQSEGSVCQRQRRNPQNSER